MGWNSPKVGAEQATNKPSSGDETQKETPKEKWAKQGWETRPSARTSCPKESNEPLAPKVSEDQEPENVAAFLVVQDH